MDHWISLSFKMLVYRLTKQTNWNYDIIHSEVTLVFFFFVLLWLIQKKKNSTEWLQWILAVAVFSGLIVSFSLSQFRRNIRIRQIYSFTIGLCCGLYLSMFHLPREVPLPITVLFLTSCILASFILVFSRWPSVSSHTIIPYLYTLFELLFFVIYISLKISFPYGPKSSNSSFSKKSASLPAFLKHLNLLGTLRSSLIILMGLYVVSNVLIASLMKFLQPIEQISQWKTKKQNYTPQSKKVQLHLDFTPHMGNASCFLAVFQSHFLCIWFLSSSSLGILFYAPIFLFLNKEPFFFKNLTPEKRYFPVLFSISSILVLSSLQMVFWPSSAELFASDLVEGVTFFWAFRNLTSLACTLPALFVINKLAWTRGAQSSYVWMLLIPINFFSLFFTNLAPVQALALLNFLGVIAVHLFDSNVVSHFVSALLDENR